MDASVPKVTTTTLKICKPLYKTGTSGGAGDVEAGCVLVRHSLLGGSRARIPLRRHEPSTKYQSKYKSETLYKLQGLLELKDTHRPYEDPMLLGIDLPEDPMAVGVLNFE